MSLRTIVKHNMLIDVNTPLCACSVAVVVILIKHKPSWKKTMTLTTIGQPITFIKINAPVCAASVVVVVHVVLKDNMS